MRVQKHVLLSLPSEKLSTVWCPLGLKCAPDLAQKVMENVLRDIEATAISLVHFSANVYLKESQNYRKNTIFN